MKPFKAWAVVDASGKHKRHRYEVYRIRFDAEYYLRLAKEWHEGGVWKVVRVVVQEAK